MQGWRTRFADAGDDDWYRPDRWPGFRYTGFRRLLRPHSGRGLFRNLRSAVRFFNRRYHRGATPDLQRELHASIRRHPYTSSWPSWPLLMRPIWYQFDKIGDDRVQAIMFLGNPLILWPALAALGICLRDWIVTRRADAFLILSFYLGPWLAWAALPRTIGFIYYYLPSATVATLALVYALTSRRSSAAALAAVGVRCGRLCRFRGVAADLRGRNRSVDGNLLPADDLQELDLGRAREAARASSLDGPWLVRRFPSFDARLSINRF